LIEKGVLKFQKRMKPTRIQKVHFHGFGFSEIHIGISHWPRAVEESKMKK